GAIVKEFWPDAAAQFDGYEIEKPGPRVCVKSLLGRICSRETFEIVSGVPAPLPPGFAPDATVCFKLAGTAPLWMFSCAQRPDFAPSAISCWVYDRVLAACFCAVWKD